MSIRYSLKDNPLTSDPNDYRPQVEIASSADIDAVAQRMLELGSTVGIEDIRAVLSALEKACLFIVLEGRRINLGELVDIYPRMKGVFNGLLDNYDANRHQVGAGASVSRRFLNQIRSSVQVEKMPPSIPKPDPLEFVDAAVETANEGYTAGSIGTLNGARLAFDAEEADQGIYFISVEDGTETKVSMVPKNSPSQLIFLIPAGLTGDQYLEVRNKMRDGNELRTGRLMQVLSSY